jgi:UDPglucose 6-dehydrogenase
MKKIGIVGVGFVGGALNRLLKSEFEIFLYDPAKKTSCTKNEINNCDVIFLCVPTPFDWSINDYNYSAIYQSFSWIRQGALVVLKSTVQPGFCRRISNQYDHKIVFNPEFLRERSADRDMKGADRVLLGGDRKDCLRVSKIYKKVYPSWVKYIYCSWESAELAKIATNAYLACKVSFCNELNDFCSKSDISYEEFCKVWLSDKRIGNSHTSISDQGGFGGSCFPKDLNALITKMKVSKTDPTMLEAAWEVNQKYRAEFKNSKYERK